MNEKILRSANVEMIFNENPFHIEGIFILPERTKVCAKGLLNFFIRTRDALSDPVFLSGYRDVIFKEDEISFLLIDDSEKYSAQFNIISSDAGIRIRVDVSAPEPVWLIEWKLSGFDFDKLLIPALGGQEISSKMPEGNTLSYKYPFWWNAQFAMGMKEDDGLLINSRDGKPDLKLLRIGREHSGFSITYGFEAEAPIESGNMTAEFYLTGFKDGWQNGAELYRTWMEKTFAPVEYLQHKGFPAWAENISFVFELWGARKSFTPGHTFSQMIERLKVWKEYYPPENTLVYLAGFAENGIDSHAPDYNPGEQCGGETEFKKLMDAAHSMGYKVMLHTNVLAMTFTHKLYKEFHKFQVIDPFGREQGWGMDMDGDWLPEPYFAYINPGYTEWGDLMEKVLGNLIEKYGADAVFLDQTLLAFNVSKGPNFITGMRDHITRLQNRFPGILFAGEGLHEQNVSALPFAQLHGIDSLTEVHGMEGQVPWRKAHPVSTYLFEKYTRYTGHLLTRHPSNPMFAFQEAAYSELGVIPVLSLYNYEQKMELPEVKVMIERAKSLSEKSEITK